MRMIYLAGPYSSPDKKIQNKRRRMFSKIASIIFRSEDVAIIDPITSSAAMVDQAPEILHGGFEQWKEVDLEFISRCDAVYVITMDGWLDSVGVQAELEYAREIGKPIFFISPRVTVENYSVVSDLALQHMIF